MQANKLQQLKDRLAEFERVKAKDKAIIQNFKDIIQRLDNKGVN